MRLICTLEDQRQGYQLSSFLMGQGIENQLEVITNTDWDSSDYGSVVCRVWAYDEDQMENALRLTNEFLSNPDQSRFQLPSNISQKPTLPSQVQDKGVSSAPPPKKTFQSPKEQPLGAITLYTLIICVLLLIVSTFTSPSYRNISHRIPPTPVFTSPINKALMYDYPKAYQLIDRIVNAYGIESLQNLETLPSGGQQLLKQFDETPYWQGFYDKVVAHFKQPEQSWNFNAPLFEKIRNGEVWRLFTPALLHEGLFHLFFNMIWLVVLGRQIEQKIGSLRYLIFIAVTAAISNTAQYLMSGADFLGFSGVLCAMLAFIWVRQRRAGWEGYQLDRNTFAFIAFFILFMFALQNLSFFLEVYSNTVMPIGIANTAHVIGALSGYVLGHMKFFTWQTNKVR